MIPPSRNARSSNGSRSTGDRALGGQLVHPEIRRVLAASHLDHREHRFEMTVDLDVALHEDVVRDERYTLRREPSVGIGIDDLGGHEDRYARARERADQAVE